MAKSQRAKEPTVKEMQRLIYQVNKRLYRLEKSGIHETSSAYKNALEIIQRGERKQDKKRLTVAKNESNLKRQYLKALEITNAENYDDLSKQYLTREIKRIQKIQAGENRNETFKNRYGIDDADYAIYNLFKTRQYKELASAGAHYSQVVLSAISDAINVNVPKAQIRNMLRDFMRESQDDTSYDFKKLKKYAKQYASKYALEDELDKYHLSYDWD